MPKKTFFNLPQRKRERIIKSALDLFASNPYHAVSVNRLVKAAGIPKGSFYQYFQDKKDLFHYLIQLIYVDKVKRLREVLTSTSNLFEILRAMTYEAVEFARENPEYTAIANRLMIDPELKREILHDFTQDGNGFLEELILRSYEKGELDTDLEPEVLARIITSVFQAMGDYIYEKSRDLSAEKSKELFIKVINLLEHGLKGCGKDD
ncbi:hypothetical protein AT15_05500 [Kosmotoga arenicorallina S304]|uniref:HTH tetR-type domain-containing protein n=1 Tax=Kosmotoga arenicorallina S304 TaxID=1453497 RepID=A0A182C7E7_9BACT|nr:TetR/AcrR family transcriptional regulator [Kosmotoga arenicorallina]OAA31529.1 hypothetical protein AT15_05500 [Kosmotoga arenicorallina S304]